MFLERNTFGVGYLRVTSQPDTAGESPAEVFMERIPVGTRVWSESRHEHGVIEEYNSRGNPCVRWEYGNLTADRLEGLEICRLLARLQDEDIIEIGTMKKSDIAARIKELGEDAWG